MKKLFNNPMRNCKDAIDRLRVTREMEDVRDNYNITERNGKIYLLVGQRVVREFPNEMTVGEVLNELNKARNAQLTYMNANPKKD